MEYLRQPSFCQASFTLQQLKKDEKLLSLLNKALKVLQYTYNTYVCVQPAVCNDAQLHMFKRVEF